jgi:hypothetical protein
MVRAWATGALLANSVTYQKCCRFRFNFETEFHALAHALESRKTIIVIILEMSSEGNDSSSREIEVDGSVEIDSGASRRR